MGEQDRPLAPIAFRYSSEENSDYSSDESKRILRRRRGIICCCCCTATIAIIGLIILILTLTIFKVKSPKLTFNSVKIVGLDLALRTGSLPVPRPGLNMSFISDISIKNPNSASFKFTNATTQLYYSGVVIGEVRSPPGNVGAHKTIHMNVSIDMMVDTVTRVSRFPSDVIAGEMPIETYTYIHGRVNVLNVIKKHVDMELKCTMTVVLLSQKIKEKVCKRTVHM